MKKVLSLIAFLVGAVSCIYPYEASLDGTQDEIVVLEGDIVIGGMATVRISQVRSFGEEGTHQVSKTGMAWVEDERGGVYKGHGASLDSQFSIHMEEAPEDLKYRIKAEVDGVSYVSDWLDVLDPPVIEKINVGQGSDRNKVQVTVNMRGGDDATGYIGINYEETWRFHTDYVGNYDLDTKRWDVVKRTEPYPNYWCWITKSNQGMILLDYSEVKDNKIVSYPLIDFPRTDNRNHEAYSIIVKAVTLPKETYRYLKNLDEISEGSGSLFSPNPGEMSSNVWCESDPGRRVLGYVTACRVASRRESAATRRFYSYTAPPTSYLFMPENRGEYKEDYENGAYPVDWMSLPKGENGEYVEGVYWGPLRCIDCVAAGGTLVRPDFW